jgi:hypothetical protein
MPYLVREFEDTPNPNAIKCVLDRPISDGRASFTSSEAASEHPVAAALFEVRGVANVMLYDDWLTIGREPGANWRTIRTAVSRVLEQLP